MTDASPEGLLLIDKPAGVTSHDVVGRIRSIFNMRRVGHAGTLDPMATGLLVVAVGRATKLLGYISGRDKRYSATIRLGQTTNTDDADGEIAAVADVADVSAITVDDIAAALARQRGEIMQRPSSVSAIKVAGQRAYHRVRAGENVELAARAVTINQLNITSGLRLHDGVADIDIAVGCSTGTYIRAIARDLGAVLSVGGHLTQLRRWEIEPFSVTDAIAIYPSTTVAADQRRPPIDDELIASCSNALISVDEIAQKIFTGYTVTADQATELRYGRTISAAGLPGVYAALDEAGQLLALVEDVGDKAKPVLGWRAH